MCPYNVRKYVSCLLGIMPAVIVADISSLITGNNKASYESRLAGVYERARSG